MTEARERGGLAVATLGAILVITVAWWALALWPVPADVPEWVLRTRAACFGTTPSGLPNAGGWILLIGEPIGMIGVLVAAWGGALRADLRQLRASLAGRATLAATAALMVLGVVATVRRVHAAEELVAAAVFVPRAIAGTVETAPLGGRAPLMQLVDQRGDTFSLEQFRGRRVMVTFAYANCETVCPVIVSDLQALRRKLGAADAAIVIVTLDPWRDTPARLAAIAARWQLGADDRVLSGPVPEVLQALEAWNVPNARDERTGEVAHTPAVMLVNRDGRVQYRVSGGWQRVAALLQTL